MKKIETEKLYYGFPIFVLGYEDCTFNYNITACSSSYSLGEMLVFALFEGSNAAKQISTYKRCTLNVLGKQHMDIIEHAGYHSGENKLEKIDYVIDKNEQLPYLEQSFLTLFLEVEKIEYYSSYANFICRINKRMVSEELIEDGTLDITKLAPPIYAGDGHKRLYRFLDVENIQATGSYLKIEK